MDVQETENSGYRTAYRECPLCGCREIPALRHDSCSHHPLYKHPLPDVITWLRCGGCGHVFTSGHFSSEGQALIFSGTNPHQAVGQNAEQMRFVSSRIVQRIARYRQSGDWLDVGFGNGSLLFTAAEWGFRPVGTDLRQSNVESIKSFGYEAYTDDIQDLSLRWPGRFSVVSMADVLEHMPFPAAALESVRRLLVPDGVLFLSMPNMATAVWDILTKANANPFWGEIEHYHNFSRERLYCLLDECGFRPVEYGVSERYRLCMEVIAKTTVR